jgi:hypothetical protein
MAHEVLSGRPIWIDGYQFDSQLNQAAIDYGADALDVTSLADTTHIMRAGLKSAGFAVDGFFDVSAGADSIDKKLFDQISLANLPVMIAAQAGTAGQIGYFMNTTLGEYNPQGAIGEVYKISARGLAQGDLVRGTIIANLSDITSSAASSGQQIGAATAAQTIFAVLFVTKADGDVSPTLDVVIESDDNGSFTSATTRFSFAEKGAIGSEYLTLAGAVTDDYWRIDYTLGGTNPDFDFAVALGIH